MSASLAQSVNPSTGDLSISGSEGHAASAIGSDSQDVARRKRTLSGLSEPDSDSNQFQQEKRTRTEENAAMPPTQTPHIPPGAYHHPSWNQPPPPVIKMNTGVPYPVHMSFIENFKLDDHSQKLLLPFINLLENEESGIAMQKAMQFALSLRAAQVNDAVLFVAENNAHMLTIMDERYHANFTVSADQKDDILELCKKTIFESGRVEFGESLWTAVSDTVKFKAADLGLGTALTHKSAQNKVNSVIKRQCSVAKDQVRLQVETAVANSVPFATFERQMYREFFGEYGITVIPDSFTASLVQMRAYTHKNLIVDHDAGNADPDPSSTLADVPVAASAPVKRKPGRPPKDAAKKKAATDGKAVVSRLTPFFAGLETEMKQTRDKYVDKPEDLAKHLRELRLEDDLRCGAVTKDDKGKVIEKGTHSKEKNAPTIQLASHTFPKADENSLESIIAANRAQPAVDLPRNAGNAFFPHMQSQNPMSVQGQGNIPFNFMGGAGYPGGPSNWGGMAATANGSMGGFNPMMGQMGGFGGGMAGFGTGNVAGPSGSNMGGANVGM
ncbi:hypothetical protein SISNIDRAFT_490650 [Sistotremastrum niveocremeum HHB9708]|uniref:Uncharacterized protein n=1 Tax=Sistotremastrum niveocremeum HHB9708 TaxID=1314777 RepID=A0A164NM80_9AGAM|nr:hypothetical protein SISNIDRAFT_490650 [Sistotremastrum niveocremeum HHB9708]